MTRHLSSCAVIATLLLAGCGSQSHPKTSLEGADLAASGQQIEQKIAAAKAKRNPKVVQAEERAATAKQESEERAERGQEERQAKESSETEAAQLQYNESTEAAQKREAKAAEAKASAGTNAKKLVEIAKQEPVEADDSDVQAVESHLLSLSHKCSESIHTLAAEIDASVDILKEAGIKESAMALAAGFDRAAPGKKLTSDCRGVLAALVTLVEKG